MRVDQQKDARHDDHGGKQTADASRDINGRPAKLGEVWRLCQITAHRLP